MDRSCPTPAERELLELDRAAVRVSRGRGAIDLAIGECLLRLRQTGGLGKLGFARQVDYARERMGVSPRLVRLLLQLARGLRGLPRLRCAVIVGAVPPCNALAVLPVAAADEVHWTAAAMSCTKAQLEAAVRSRGKEPPRDFEAESLVLAMNAKQQDRLDAGLDRAQETLGFGAPRWKCLEAMAQEWLGTFGARPWAFAEPAAPEVLSPLPSRVDEHLAVVEEAHGIELEDAGTDDPRELDARIVRLLEARRGFDGAFGPLLLRLDRARAWRFLGYRSQEEYCRERLGIASQSFRERVWLERRMEELPELREALAAGRLKYSKALLVAREASPEDVGEWIAQAERTSWKHLDRETTACEDRRNRAAGVKRVWGPKEAMETLAEAIVSAQRLSEEPIDSGEALARIADHFVEVWDVHLKRRRVSTRRREVLLRSGGMCAVPTCTRGAEHIHHIVYRSRGGPEEAWNEVALCAAHHLFGIHRGYVSVRGRAGERLDWRTPLGDWITYANDDAQVANSQ